MKKILLASQYKTLLQKYSNLLVNWGFNIFTTTSGSEVLRLNKEHKFDLIISDFELEGLCMSTFCSLIRNEESSKHIPVIITCHNIQSRISRANLSGANDIVIKPIDPIKFLETIGNHVGLNLIRSKRVEINIVVTIKKHGQEFTCFSRDISATGLLIKSDYALHIGDLISCKFTLPGFFQVEADGEIVRYMTDIKCDNLYGINFSSISSFCRMAINGYVNSPSSTHSIHKINKSDKSISKSKQNNF